ncbi:hypothetical protein PYCCODRAFT_1425566 [Trametes coccinea BRFM310]|uniref:Uncharacterized protein n=1 Tax=Trametes coccinea (strain BRFM310) TaxID=1353009 RepID=A0A1Y2IL47_TRAC3|nr:hypothetical protein PYCCODRAFT_1425566 [Trametes coccinea BRFM310]
MPELRRSPGNPMHSVIAASDVLFNINVPHNCRDGGCSAKGRRAVRQERQDTNISVPVIEHADDCLYILNTHALHHAALVRKALPRYLTAPLPYITDREASHKQTATDLRKTHDARRRRDADARQARKAKTDAEKARTNPGEACASAVATTVGDSVPRTARTGHSCAAGEDLGVSAAADIVTMERNNTQGPGAAVVDAERVDAEMVDAEQLPRPI